MPRVKRGNVRRAKRKKLLKRAKGFYQTKSKLYRAAKESVDTALKYAYVGRKNKKREFRRLWVVRINAAARENGITYSQLVRGLKAAGSTLDRHVAPLPIRFRRVTTTSGGRRLSRPVRPLRASCPMHTQAARSRVWKRARIR